MTVGREGGSGTEESEMTSPFPCYSVNHQCQLKKHPVKKKKKKKKKKSKKKNEIKNKSRNNTFQSEIPKYQVILNSSGWNLSKSF